MAQAYVTSVVSSVVLGSLGLLVPALILVALAVGIFAACLG